MLLEAHHQDIEFDLLKMGVDLLDFWRGILSPRRLTLILRRLPPDSELRRAIDPDTALLASWKAGEYLTAHLIDMYARVNFKEPKPFPRPLEQLQTLRRHAALERQGQRIRAAIES